MLTYQFCECIAMCQVNEILPYLYRTVFCYCPSSYHEDFRIAVRWRGPLLCKGEVRVPFRQVKQGRDSVRYAIWLLFEQSCFDKFRSSTF